MKQVRLLWAVVVLAAGWSAWWGWGAWSAKSGLESWMEARRAAGWQAEWSDISVRGYPTRIDRTITGLTLADTKGGWVWNAPFFQILGLNYQKQHVILVWPDTQTLQTPHETIAISGDEMQGSVTFLPGGDKALDQATLVFKGLMARSDAGWTSSVREARLATRPVADAPLRREVGLEVMALKPRSETLSRLAEAGIVASTVEKLSADLVIDFDRPWDRQAIETVRPQPQKIDIREIAVTWGQLELRIAGALTVDKAGEVSGDVLVKATNWREILDLFRDSGVLAETLANGIESALVLLSGLAGSSETLDIPVTFEGGRTRIGLVSIAPSPVVKLP